MRRIGLWFLILVCLVSMVSVPCLAAGGHHRENGQGHQGHGACQQVCQQTPACGQQQNAQSGSCPLGGYVDADADGICDNRSICRNDRPSGCGLRICRQILPW